MKNFLYYAELVNIKSIPHCQFRTRAELTYYKNQFQSLEEGNYNEFLELVEKFNMVSIMKRKDHWHEIFFLKSFLNSIND